MYVDCGGSCSACRLRKPITVQERSGSTLTDYQVLVTTDTQSLISSGKMRSDCGDMRFTDSDGSTQLSYWIESGCNSGGTRIWIKVPYTGASTTKTIYMTYGSPGLTSSSSFANTFIAPNGNFEFDSAGTSKGAITYWDFSSGYAGENADWTSTSYYAAVPSANNVLSISTSRRFSGSYSVYTFLKSANNRLSSSPYDYEICRADDYSRAAVQRLYSEDAYRYITSSNTLYLWLTSVSYTAPSRWSWTIGIILNDGSNQQNALLACKCWGHNEGCPGNSYNGYDTTATGADGTTWYRYPVYISGVDKTRLTIKLIHFQDAWDCRVAQSELYWDLFSGNGDLGLRKYVANEPATSVGAETAY